MIDQDADAIVASEIYPLAVKQARGQIVIEVLVLAPLIALGAFAGFPRPLVWFAGLIITGVVATAYDIRWWLWLRKADPVEGYRRLQARPSLDGGKFRSRLTLGLSLVAGILWLVLPR